MSVVETVVDAAFPDRTLRGIEPIETGNRRRSAIVRFADADPVVVQHAPDGGFDIEAALRAAIRERTSVPVPATAAVGRVAGGGYLVSEYRPGRDLHTVFADLSRDRRATIARTFGRYLGELHAAFTFDGCGEVRQESSDRAGGGPASFTVSGAPCGEWLREYGGRAIDRLPDEFDSLRERLRDPLRSAANGDTSPARLYPWDLRPGNALYGEKLTAIVDWERPLAAPAGLALAKTTYLVAAWYVEDPDPLREALRRGYRRVRPLPTVPAGHRVAAIADSAVDSHGVVTRPGYPEADRERAIRFHRRALAEAVGR